MASQPRLPWPSVCGSLELTARARRSSSSAWILPSRGSVCPFSHPCFRWSTLLTRHDRYSFLFSLPSPAPPFVPTTGQRNLLLIFLLANISLRIPWVKWLQELEVLTTFPLGYWEQRGWDPDGLVRTESRFDVPADHSQVRSPFIAAGVAWAGTRGVSRVEVSINDGRSWRAAELEQVADTPSWRRWKITLELLPGVYPLSVRAIDGTGRVQDATYRPPHPSGTSGYHRIVVTVRDETVVLTAANSNP